MAQGGIASLQLPCRSHLHRNSVGEEREHRACGSGKAWGGGATVYFPLFLFEERRNERKMKGRKG